MAEEPAATRQWPSCDGECEKLSNYLTSPDELGMNAMEVADILALGLRPEVDESAGIVRFAGTRIVCASDLRPPPVLYSSSLVRLAVKVLLSEYHPGFVVALAYSRLSVRDTPAHAFWVDVHDRLSWRTTPSMLFVVALAIQRADIQAFVRLAHQGMALALRSNRRVDAALSVLCGLDGSGPRQPWEVSSESALFAVLQRVIACGQIPVAAGEKTKDSDLLINGTCYVRMAVRDRILVAVVLLFHAPGALLGASHVPWHRGLPGWAPPAFHACASEYPELISNKP